MEEPRGPSAECSAALERLFEFFDNELATADADRIRQHIADCEPCMDQFLVADVMKRLVRRSCSEQAPAELRIRIHSELTVLRHHLAE